MFGSFDSVADGYGKDVVLLFCEGWDADSVEDIAPEGIKASLLMLFQLATLPLLLERASDCVSVPSEVPWPLLLSSRLRSTVDPYRLG